MGLHSASSSSDYRRSCLSSEEEEDVACAAPLRDNGSMWREREHCPRTGFFVGCKSWERKGALCEDGVFMLVARVGRGEEGAGRKGYLWPEEPIQSLLKKLLLKRLE
jgi:hypothetical protein